MASAGFGPMDLNSFTLNGKPLTGSYRDAITNVILQRTMLGVSTVTFQITDPNRVILPTLAKSTDPNKLGTSVIIDGNLSFTYAQLVKASDQLQLVFEPTPISRLKLKRGRTTPHVSMAVTQWMASMVGELGYKLVAPDYATTWKKLIGNKAASSIGPIQLSRGTTADVNESSWGAMNRIAGGIGWRLWEYAGTFFFGPDEYWLGNLTNGVPPINNVLRAAGKQVPVLRERTLQTQIIDADHDVGKPFGQGTVTMLLDQWTYNVGEVVEVAGCGPLDDFWLIASMQRDMFQPEATLTLQVPMPLSAVVIPNSLPQAGFPLAPIHKSMFP